MAVYSSRTKPANATLSKQPLAVGPPPPPPSSLPFSPSFPQDARPHSLAPSLLSPDPSDAISTASSPHPIPPAPTPDLIFIHVQQSDSSLTIACPALGLPKSTFPFHWLRDASPQHIDSSTKQKPHRSTDVALDVWPRSIEPAEVGEGEYGVVVEWQRKEAVEGNGGEPDVSIFTIAWLKEHATREGWLAAHHPPSLSPLLWPRASSLPLSPPPTRFPLRIPYTSFLSSPHTKLAALKHLVRHGLVFFDGVPTEKKEGWETEVKRLVGEMGELRRTWYGDLWDVRSEGKEAKNVAYTSVALDLHMDLVHFQNPPRFQLLHSLLNTVPGGLSTFLDAFALIPSLSPQSLRTLATRPIPFVYRNGGHHTHWVHPTIQLRPGWSADDLLAEGVNMKTVGEAVEAVNYSPPFQAPLLLRPPWGPPSVTSNPYTPKQHAALHSALSEFASLAAEAERRLDIRLEPGICVAFDNRRVLHARTAFEEGVGVGGEKRERWFKGAYVEGDSVWDRVRVLEAELGDQVS